uniref:COP9 complex family protein n=1 Tax=Rhizophora mucronata TaxID=61149 RepID=A0A2P2K9R5_RHIMU
MGSGPDVSAQCLLDCRTELKRMSFMTCDIRPWTCSTVILALSRVILASCDSSCNSQK